jgi:hypothetical protein
MRPLQGKRTRGEEEEEGEGPEKKRQRVEVSVPAPDAGDLAVLPLEMRVAVLSHLPLRALEDMLVVNKSLSAAVTAHVYKIVYDQSVAIARQLDAESDARRRAVDDTDSKDMAWAMERVLHLICENRSAYEDNLFTATMGTTILKKTELASCRRLIMALPVATNPMDVNNGIVIVKWMFDTATPDYDTIGAGVAYLWTRIRTSRYITEWKKAAENTGLPPYRDLVHFMFMWRKLRLSDWVARLFNGTRLVGSGTILHCVFPRTGVRLSFRVSMRAVADNIIFSFDVEHNVADSPAYFHALSPSIAAVLHTLQTENLVRHQLAEFTMQLRALLPLLRQHVDVDMYMEMTCHHGLPDGLSIPFGDDFPLDRATCAMLMSPSKAYLFGFDGVRLRVHDSTLSCRHARVSPGALMVEMRKPRDEVLWQTLWEANDWETFHRAVLADFEQRQRQQ